MNRALQQLRAVGLGATAAFLETLDPASAATFASTLARCGRKPEHDNQRAALRQFAEAVEKAGRAAATREAA